MEQLDYSKIMIITLRIIWNGIRDTFEKHDVLPQEEVHNLGTGYMELECVKYEY